MLRRAFKVLSDISPFQRSLLGPRSFYNFTTSSSHRSWEESEEAWDGSGASTGPLSGPNEYGATASFPPGSASSSILPGSRPSTQSQGLSQGRPWRIHVQATSNNTLITLTDAEGRPRFWTSGGKVGFKKAARSGYEAGYQAALSLFSKIESGALWRRSNGKPFSRFEIVWKGFGQGRDAFLRALLSPEGQKTRMMVRSMTDATKIKIGGVRPKKRRNY